MSRTSTAEIIPFPARQPEPVVAERATAIPGSAESQVRLANALQSLDQALTEQRAAIAAWRDALGQLRATVSGLGNSVQNYRDTLDALDTKVVTLNGEARRLESWADDAITQSASADAPQGG